MRKTMPISLRRIRKTVAVKGHGDWDPPRGWRKIK